MRRNGMALGVYPYSGIASTLRTEATQPAPTSPLIGSPFERRHSSSERFRVSQPGEPAASTEH